MHNASFIHRLQTTVQSNFTDLQTTVKKYLANVQKKSPQFQTTSPNQRKWRKSPINPNY